MFVAPKSIVTHFTSVLTYFWPMFHFIPLENQKWVKASHHLGEIYSNIIVFIY